MSEHKDNQPTSDTPEADKVIAWMGANKLLSTIIGLVAVFALIAGFVAVVDWVKDAAADNERIAAEYKKDQAHKAEQKAAKQDAETPAQKVRKAIDKALGDDSGRKGVKRVQSVEYDDVAEVVDVKFAVKEAVTNKLTKASARLDISKLLEEVQKLQRAGVEVQFMNFVGTYPLIDDLGKSKEESVVRVSYKGDAVSKINFDRFLHKDVYKIADDVDIQPAFKD